MAYTPPLDLRYYVNFNGTGTPATRGTPRNHGSITDNGTGDWTLNFTAALPTANYTVLGLCGDDGTNLSRVGIKSANVPTASALRVTAGMTTVTADVTYCCLACVGV